MTGFPRQPLAALLCCLFAGGALGMTRDGADAALMADAPAEVLAVSSGSEVNVTDAAPPVEALPRLDRLDMAALAEAVSGDDAPVSLRRERRFDVRHRKPEVRVPVAGMPTPPIQLKTDNVLPLFLIANEVKGDADETTEAEGDVELRKADMLLYADHVVYYPLEDVVDATGHVRLLQDGAEIDTPHLRMRMSEKIGFAEDAHYLVARMTRSRFYPDGNGLAASAITGNATVGSASASAIQGSTVHMMSSVPHVYGLPTKMPPARLTEMSGDAERINFEGEDRLRLVHLDFSTCKPGERDWYVKAEELYLKYDLNRGEAKDATVYFKDVPIGYTPYADFALNHQRKSGLLHPTFISSSRNGMDVTLPYYWNIAPNYDATLYPRYMDKRGFQLGAEARYLEHNFSGVVRAEYLPEDSQLARSRYAYTLQHTHNLGQSVALGLNLNGVSDDTYWQDMSSRVAMTSSVQLPRQISLSANPRPWLSSSLQVLQYQTLQTDPANPVTRPYFIEPQFNLGGYVPDVLKTDLSFIGQFTRFSHPTKVDGDRVVFYPQISLPIINPGYQITPKIGLHSTYYNLSHQAAGEPTTISRTLPVFSFDASMTFERDMDWFGRDYVQTLEPRLYYVNIPYRDQSRLPLFDTGVTDFSFAQIFAENRYGGYDRINDANQLTAGLTSRMIDAKTGAELFKAMVGQRYYFKEQRVTLDNTEVVRNHNFSSLIVGVTGLAAPKTYVDAALEFDPQRDQTERMAAGVRYQPDYGKVLSASYRYTRDAATRQGIIDQVDIAGQWPLAPRWFGVSRLNYSLKDRQSLETIAGLEYNAGCWAVRMVGQRLAAIAGAPNTSLFFQLELTDLASVGSNPIQLLRRTIPGYGKTNELPTTGSLLTTE